MTTTELAGARELGQSWLDFLWLEVTQKCTLECVHCYADSSPRSPLYGDMTTADWCRVLSESYQAGCRQVQFIGGEPTAHPDLSRMIDFASQIGFGHIEVFTNAMHLSDAALDQYGSLGVRVACSFYSASPEVHERITRVPSSHARTVATIDRLVRREIPLRVGVVEMELNRGCADEAIEFLQHRGVKNVTSDRIRGVGRGSNERPSPSGSDDVCGHCWRGRLCVTTSGGAFPCVMSRSSNVGNVRTHSMTSLLASDELRGFRDRVRSEFEPQPASNDPHRVEPSACDPATPCFPAACSPNGPCSPTQAPCTPTTVPCMPGKGPCFPAG